MSFSSASIVVGSFSPGLAEPGCLSTADLHVQAPPGDHVARGSRLRRRLVFSFVATLDVNTLSRGDASR